MSVQPTGAPVITPSPRRPSRLNVFDSSSPDPLTTAGRGVGHLIIPDEIPTLDFDRPVVETTETPAAESTKKPARKPRARKLDADGNPIPPKPRARKLDAEGNPIPPKPRAKKLDENGNPIPPKPRAPRKKPTKDAANTGTDSLAGSTKPTRKAPVPQKKAASVIESGVKPRKPVDYDAPLNLEAALPRRQSWTPPPVDTTMNNESIVSENANPLATEYKNRGKVLFAELKDNYGCQDTGESSRSTSTTELPFKKCKLIEMLPSKDPFEAPKKPTAALMLNAIKAPRKKFSTMTEHAIAQYDNHVDLSYITGYQDPELAQQPKPEDTEVGNMKMKRRRKKEKPVDPTKILFSPGTAMRQADNQDFLFGTSSQLVREDSPGFVRELQAALEESRRMQDELGMGDNNGESKANKMWLEASRGELGVIDLEADESLPLMREEQEMEEKTGVGEPLLLEDRKVPIEGGKLLYAPDSFPSLSEKTSQKESRVVKAEDSAVSSKTETAALQHKPVRVPDSFLSLSKGSLIKESEPIYVDDSFVSRKEKSPVQTKQLPHVADSFPSLSGEISIKGEQSVKVKDSFTSALDRPLVPLDKPVETSDSFPILKDSTPNLPNSPIRASGSFPAIRERTPSIDNQLIHVEDSPPLIHVQAPVEDNIGVPLEQDEGPDDSIVFMGTAVAPSQFVPPVSVAPMSRRSGLKISTSNPFQRHTKSPEAVVEPPERLCEIAGTPEEDDDEEFPDVNVALGLPPSQARLSDRRPPPSQLGALKLQSPFDDANEEVVNLLPSSPIKIPIRSSPIRRQPLPRSLDLGVSLADMDFDFSDSDISLSMSPVQRKETQKLAITEPPRKDSPGPSNAAKAETHNDIPDWSTMTDAQLSSRVSSFGFKPIHKRSEMISLLVSCYAKRPVAFQPPPVSTSISAVTHFTTSSQSGRRDSKNDDSICSIPQKRRRGSKKDIFSDTDDCNDGVEPVAKRGCTPRGKGKGRAGVTSKSSSPTTRTRGRGSPKKTTEKKSRSPARKTTQKTKVSALQASAIEIGDSEDELPRLRSRSPNRNLDPDSSISDNGYLSAAHAGSDTHIGDISLAVDSVAGKKIMFNAISEAVQTATRTRDPTNPSWYDRILLFDPIVYEDLMEWLNAGELERVGFDHGVIKSDVKAWCETKSICCIDKETSKGHQRKRI